MFRIGALLTCAASAMGQVSLDGLRLGYAVDETAQVLRPLMGTPGSAYLGPAVTLPFGVQSAVVRGGVMVLVSSGPDSQAFAVRGVSGEAPQLTELGPAKRVHLDNSGALALVEGNREIRFVSGLPAAPNVGPAVNLDIADGEMSAATFLQGQNCFVVAVKTAEGSALHRLCAGKPGELAPLRTLDGFTVNSMAYDGEAGLFVVDREANRVALIRNPLSSGTVETLASGDSGIDNPVGIVSLGGQEAMVALGGSAKAVVLSATSAGTAATIDLPATPDRLEFLIQNRLLSCTALLDQPLLVIDLLQDRAPFFIPLAGGLQ